MIFIRLKKRYFQLLEIMVASFLILVCAAPALRIYTTVFLKQQEIVTENQRDHLAHLIHAYLAEQLYKRLIPFNQILEKKEAPLEDPELKTALQKIGYQGFYLFDQVEKKNAKAEDEKSSMYLVTLIIILKPINGSSGNSNTSFSEAKYDYKVFIAVPQRDEDLNQPVDEENMKIDDQTNQEEEESTDLDNEALEKEVKVLGDVLQEKISKSQKKQEIK